MLSDVAKSDEVIKRPLDGRTLYIGLRRVENSGLKSKDYVQNLKIDEFEAENRRDESMLQSNWNH